MKLLVFCVVIFIAVAATKAFEGDTKTEDKEEADFFPEYWQLDYNNDYSAEVNNGGDDPEDKADYIEKQVVEEQRAVLESKEENAKSVSKEFDPLMDYVLEDNRSSTEDKVINQDTEILSKNDSVTNPELKVTPTENKGESNEDTDSNMLNDWWSEEETDEPLLVPTEEVVDENFQLNKELSASNEKADPDLDQIIAETTKLLEESDDFDVDPKNDIKINDNNDNGDALEINKIEETPEEVLKDLNSDLDELLETLDKMSKDDSDETENDEIVNNAKGIDDVQDNEDKNETLLGEGYIMSLRDDYENFFSRNLSEFFTDTMNISSNSVDYRDIQEIIAQQISDIEGVANQTVNSKTKQDELEVTTSVSNFNLEELDIPDYPHEIDLSSLLPETDYNDDNKEISDDNIKHYYGNDGLIDEQMPKNDDAEVFLTLQEVTKTVSANVNTNSVDISNTEKVPTVESEDTSKTVLTEEVSLTTEDVVTRATLMADDLNSSEYNELMSQFVIAHSNDIANNSETTSYTRYNIRLSLDEPTVITSPNKIEEPYPMNTMIDWIIDGPGMGIEMNVTNFHVNGARGDYLLVIPGGVDASRTDGLIFSYRLMSVRRYRFVTVSRMFVRFQSHDGFTFSGFSLSAKMILPLPEDDDDEPEPEPVLQAPHETLTVTLKGLTLIGFNRTRSEFKALIADMAEEYIRIKGIYPGLNSTLEVTQITRTAICNIRWPNYETCLEVTFGVPIQYEEEVDDPKLNAEDLNSIWRSYIVKEPYASRLEDMGLSEYPIPNDRSVLMVWLVIAAAVVIAMALLGFAMWRFSCFEEYTRMKAFNDSESIQNEKRNLDLYPTPHQTLPPLYTDTDYKWADNKYDESSRVDMGGFANKSYIRDDLFDLDSDEEIITMRDRKGVMISSKDVFDA